MTIQVYIINNFLCSMDFKWVSTTKFKFSPVVFVKLGLGASTNYDIACTTCFTLSKLIDNCQCWSSNYLGG